MVFEIYESRDDDMEQGGSKRGDEKWQDLDILKIKLARLGRWTKRKRPSQERLCFCLNGDSIY